MNGVDRRSLVAAAGAAALMPAAATRCFAQSAYANRSGPRSRVVLVNDLGGDVDGLFATVHAILSPSAELRAIVATAKGRSPEKLAASVRLAHEMLALTGRAGRIAVHPGAAAPMPTSSVPVGSAGTRAIIAEAMRTDTDLPLFVCAGGGLTEVASALLIEPRIAGRFTLVWIGGAPYPAGGYENNVAIDPAAAQHVFNAATVPMWQVPSTVYDTCLVSVTELQAYVAPHGRIGAWLYDRVLGMAERMKTFADTRGAPWNTGETWSLGDSPLVVLTALTSWVASNYSPGRRDPLAYEGTGGSLYDTVPAPRIDAEGRYAPRADGRPIRVYRSVDTRLMLGDLFAKLRMNYPVAG